MIRYFVTSTGTGIGKTFVTAALAAAARSRGRTVTALKPIVSGFEDHEAAISDSGILLRAQGLEPGRLEDISPWRFMAPLSPDMAAARENRRIDVQALIRFCRQALAGEAECVLIEGVGGIMVPLDGQDTVLDWMQALAIPALLVAGSYLGTISHTLTACRVLRAAGIPIHAVILDETPGSTVSLDETAAVLRRFLPEVPVITITWQPGADAWRHVPALWTLLD